LKGVISPANPFTDAASSTLVEHLKED
jgi:hypothetical protein